MSAQRFFSLSRVLSFEMRAQYYQLPILCTKLLKLSIALLLIKQLTELFSLSCTMNAERQSDIAKAQTVKNDFLM
jgi:hypothetical protein